MNRLPTVLILGALLATGCIVYTVQADSPETKTWPAAGVSTIDVRIDNGAIAVSAKADTLVTALVTKSCKGSSEADAEAHLADISTGDSVSGSTLYLWGKVPMPNSRSYNTKYEVSAPAATALHLVTANGAVTLDSISGSAVVDAANGAVGTTAHSGSINVDAANGAIDCDMAGLDSAETATLHSANGRVTINLPADASFAFDILTTNGKANVTGFTNINYSLTQEKHKVGTVGTGAATVTLRSENGNVNLQAR